MRAGTREWAVPVAAGLGLAAFAITTDIVASSRTVSLAGELAGPWLLVAHAVGRRRGEARSAAAHGLVALLVGVVAYDLPFVIAGASPLYAALWLVVAVVVGPAGGVSGWIASSASNEWLRLGAHASVWGVAVGEAGARIDPLNNRMAWVAGALALVAVATAPAGRRAVSAVVVAVVAVGAAVAFPFLLSGIAGW